MSFQRELSPVVVSNGALSNGQIVVAASTYTTPSYANQYDAAGNVAVRSTLADGSDQFLTYGGVWYAHTVGAPLTQRLVYDTRSELVETDYATAAGEVNRGAQSRETYDADGHLLSNNTYERNGQVWAVYGTTNFPNGYEYLDLSGWLWTGQVSAYGAAGAAPRATGSRLVRSVTLNPEHDVLAATCGDSDRAVESKRLAA